MCGIIGYIGNREAQDILLDGLKRLEYRGYDSCGVAVLNSDGKIVISKKEGRISRLENELKLEQLSGNIGIGHTRWATHGKPSDINSHPHTDSNGDIAIVHNGIIENYQELKSELAAKGHVFRSETDTEVVAHLIEESFKNGAKDLVEAVRSALKPVIGAYALCIVSTKQPDVLVAARFGAPLIIGVGSGENFVTSDVASILPYTKKVIYLAEKEVIEVRKEGYKKMDLDGKILDSEVKEITWDAESAEKMGYETFMLKEIYEQPEALRRTYYSLISKEAEGIEYEGMPIQNHKLRKIDKIYLVSCGTAYHAAMVGKYFLDASTDLDIQTDWSSEFRYRRLKLDQDKLIILISQSGETADTLASLRIAKSMGCGILSIVNVRDSTIARESHHILYTSAGPEIGVASTKAYTSQIMAISIFAIYLGHLRGDIRDETREQFMSELAHIPDKVARIFENVDKIRSCADKICNAKSAFYLGRGFNFPTALEGALKNKEISYMHCEGYSAGEMKHGPIALIEEKFPVIAICTRGSTYEKMVSNIKEVDARDGLIITIATEGDEFLKTISDEVIYVPEVREEFSPIVNVIPLQLLAYYIAKNRGCDIDKPRNLAKSVTVE